VAKKGTPAKSIETFGDVLSSAGSRPRVEDGADKTPYATRFAAGFARLIANELRQSFPGIKPDADGRGTESPAQALRGLKRLDVNFSAPTSGLGLGVSLKSVHVRDKKPTPRFHHNMKRNDEELRAEASGYHQRQPYSVLVAVIALPFEACDDADDRPSSFGTWVEYMFQLVRRGDVNSHFDCFEAVFIALYDPIAAEVGFFDVTVPPPRRGRPKNLLTLAELAAYIHRLYTQRNSLDFRWAE
jgi:hypothetical protein